MIMYGYRCVVGDFFHEAKNLRIDTRKGTNGPCVERSFLDVPVGSRLLFAKRGRTHASTGYSGICFR